MNEELADCGSMRLILRRVDVELHPTDRIPGLAGGHQQDDPAVSDGPLHPAPEGIRLGEVEWGHEADGSSVLHAVDEDLAKTRTEAGDLARIRGPIRL
jgi:hypothetical protein